LFCHLRNLRFAFGNLSRQIAAVELVPLNLQSLLEAGTQLFQTLLELGPLLIREGSISLHLVAQSPDLSKVFGELAKESLLMGVDHGR